MKRQRKYSLHAVMGIILSLLVVFGTVMIVWISCYISSSTQEKEYERLENMVQVNMQSLHEKTLNAEKFLAGLYNYSADLNIILSNGDYYETINGIARLNRMMQGIYPGFSGVNGMFLYFPEIDRYITAANNQSDSELSDDIKDMLRQHMDEGNEALPPVNWELREINGQYCILRIIPVQNFFVGAFLRLDYAIQLLSTPYDSSSAYILFNEDGTVRYSAVSLDDSVNYLDFQSTTVLEDTNKQKYHAFPVNGVTKNKFVVLIPVEEMVLDLSPLYITLTILIILMAITAFSISIMLTKLIIKPTHELNKLNEQIQQSRKLKDLSFPESACVEISQTIDTVEHLCQSITDLQNRYFQEKLLRSKIELSRLKSQIAPHFLVNCLYVLQNIAASGHQDSEAFSTLIQTLSEHLRYSLSDRETVSLEEEMYYVVNYIKLTQTRFPLSLEYNIAMDDEAKHASVFPLILLMLTENTIKYNMTMGEILCIEITATVIEKENRKWLKLTHRDTGCGFPEAIVEAAGNQTLFSAIEGNHIGMFNVIKRLELLFPESEIQLANQNGAIISIVLPFEPYTEETWK